LYSNINREVAPQKPAYCYQDTLQSSLFSSISARQKPSSKEEKELELKAAKKFIITLGTQVEEFNNYVKISDPENCGKPIYLGFFSGEQQCTWVNAIRSVAISSKA
jgi:hypothetical protein